MFNWFKNLPKNDLSKKELKERIKVNRGWKALFFGKKGKPSKK